MRVSVVLNLLVALIAISASSCATVEVDRSEAKVLASAGQAATGMLQQQTSQVQTSLSTLPTTIVVTEILNCRRLRPELRDGCIVGARNAALDPPMEKTRKLLVEIVNKRAAAFKALNDAYASFSDLTTYDAAKATVTSIDDAFTKVNALTGALSALPGVGLAIPAITSTVTKITGGMAGGIAEERQSQLLLGTSRDLHIAVDAMIRALRAEQDATAMKSLMVELEKERVRLETSTVGAGLASSIGILTTFYARVAPDIALAQEVGANADLVNASASEVLKQVASARISAIPVSYDRAIAALAAVSAQHSKFEEKKPVDVSLVLTELQHLRDAMQASK